MKTLHTLLSCIFLTAFIHLQAETNYYDPAPFGDANRRAEDSKTSPLANGGSRANLRKKPKAANGSSSSLENVMAFALYAHDHGVSKSPGKPFPSCLTSPSPSSSN